MRTITWADGRKSGVRPGWCEIPFWHVRSISGGLYCATCDAPPAGCVLGSRCALLGEHGVDACATCRCLDPMTPERIRLFMRFLQRYVKRAGIKAEVQVE
jgi:hypothetical protein